MATLVEEMTVEAYREAGARTEKTEDSIAIAATAGSEARTECKVRRS